MLGRARAEDAAAAYELACMLQGVSLYPIDKSLRQL